MMSQERELFLCGVRGRSLKLLGFLQTLPQMLYPMTLPSPSPPPPKKDPLLQRGSERCLGFGFLHSQKGSSTEREIGGNIPNISLLSQPRTKAVKSNSSYLRPHYLLGESKSVRLSPWTFSRRMNTTRILKSPEDTILKKSWPVRLMVSEHKNV